MPCGSDSHLGSLHYGRTGTTTVREGTTSIMSDENHGGPPQMPAGWYDDPMSIGDARYWDGVGWTTSINTDGITSTAAIEPALVGIPPVQGSQFRAQRRAAPAPTPTPITMTQSSQRSPLGAVLAAVVVIVLVVAVVVLITRDDGGGDTPSTDVPRTDSPVTDPPLTEPPVTEPPVTGG